MPILPEEIATATFNRGRQGFQPEEVEAFLREVAADYGAVLEKLYLAPDEPEVLDVGQEVNAILNTARDAANALMQRAREEARAVETATTEKAERINTEAAEARARAFERSSQDAEKVKAKADEYAFELRNRTETETRQMVERAETRGRQLFAYNQQLSEHLEEIESLVRALRVEIDGPKEAWPDGSASEQPAPHSEEGLDGESVRSEETSPERDRVVIDLNGGFDIGGRLGTRSTDSDLDDFDVLRGKDSVDRWD
jgi:DivIVA domain-containing protein